jgi:hypothetical protein
MTRGQHPGLHLGPFAAPPSADMRTSCRTSAPPPSRCFVAASRDDDAVQGRHRLPQPLNQLPQSGIPRAGTGDHPSTNRTARRRSREVQATPAACAKPVINARPETALIVSGPRRAHQTPIPNGVARTCVAGTAPAGVRSPRGGVPAKSPPSSAVSGPSTAAAPALTPDQYGAAASIYEESTAQ